MLLFKEANADKTANNVKEFLTNDYQKLCAIAGANIKSPIISGLPTAPSAGNSKESQITEVMWARDILKIINQSINACSADSRKILLGKMDFEKDYILQNDLGVSHTKYYDMLRFAYNEFADAFEYRGRPLLKNKADLHIYDQ
ncbi:hypothetical protein DS832_07060 [Bombilactobacillus bombi]|jgi:ArpU family phage transcriptional regulator|uniref:ArpU family transcriptional regulator n=1 Tax=Bombilactobacillus bombi TaxID=1303590 RepID=A0A3R6UUU2_9LACO|nr:ArpU family phage packaging/lysis transcriptional regulator [Bombilactobacillus bombi]RHW46101.1 hypothetical protein DS832_07060 [Bombilactobacillus bombi]